MKIVLYTLVGFLSTAITNVYGDFFWTEKINDDFKNDWIELVPKLDNMFTYFIWLFYFIAVVFAVYWWFRILTSWWDEEKVKKWKNIIIYVVIWLIVIFLASQFIRWIADVMTSTDTINT